MDIDGAKVRAIREARVLSLRELARQATIGPSALSDIERGKRRPHQKTVRKLAEALAIEPGALKKDTLYE